MREIKFRGKAVENGTGFTVGYFAYSPNSGKHYIYPYGKTTASPVIVDPETIGQYTGAHDESGLIEVFEHDIIEATYNDDVYIGAVSFSSGMFVFCNKDLPDGYITLNDLTCCYEDDQFSIEAKVIGNIHDNPELLEAPYDNA